MCDVVVITIPYTEKTHHMINEKMFSNMKKGVFFINLSRGSIVDENSLIENIGNEKIAGAALDVFENEPLDEKSPLWSFDNVIITPHNSWISEMRNERRFEAIYENMKRYAEGEKLVNIIDLNKEY
jgi:phosphoglycerate dehydrogenase-like enzyme